MSRVGAVLAGGRSLRMGTDKALVELDGRPMATWVADALAAAGAVDVVLAGATSQEVARRLDMALIPDRTADRGPVGGLDALFSYYEDAPVDRSVTVMSCPCDVPLVNASDLDEMATALESDPTLAAVVSRCDGRVQPLVSVWRADRCAETVASLIEHRAVPVRAVLDALAAEHALAIVDIDDSASLLNVNTPDDLAAAHEHSTS